MSYHDLPLFSAPIMAATEVHLDLARAIATACPGKAEERPAQNFIHAEMMEINKHTEC
jgi:hypothetical protein